MEVNLPDGRIVNIETDDPQAAAAAAHKFQQANPLSSPAADVAKSAGVGVGKGVIGAAGYGGDVRSLNAMAISKLAGLAGYDLPEEKVATALKVLPGMQGPSAGKIQAAVEGITGKFYKPQTTAGEYAQTVGEFVPAALLPQRAAPRIAREIPALAGRLVRQAAVPGVGSEAAGQVTEAYAPEYAPAARIASALALGGGGVKRGETLAGRAEAATVPQFPEIKQGAVDIYKAERAGNIAKPVPQTTLDRVAADVRAAVDAEGPDRIIAGTAHQVIDKIASPSRPRTTTATKTELAGPGYHIAEDTTKAYGDVADLVNARQKMKSFFQNPLPDPNKAVATIAIPKIDAAIERLSPQTMERLREADTNYAAAAVSKALNAKLTRAELRAGGEGSGLNLGNKLRQKITDYLVSEKQSRGLKASDREILEKFTKGTFPQNATRFASNLLGGGGGAWAAALGAGGLAGGLYSGHPEAALLPVAGIGLRGMYNRSVSRQAAGIEAAMRARSPYAQRAMAPLAPQRQLDQNTQRVIRALMAQEALGQGQRP